MLVDVLIVTSEVEFTTSWNVKCKSVTHSDGTLYLPLGFESELTNNGIVWSSGTIEIIDEELP